VRQSEMGGAPQQQSDCSIQTWRYGHLFTPTRFRRFLNVVREQHITSAACDQPRERARELEGAEQTKPNTVACRLLKKQPQLLPRPCSLFSRAMLRCSPRAAISREILSERRAGASARSGRRRG